MTGATLFVSVLIDTLCACGFLPTGEGQPLPSDPKLTEMGMTRFA